MNLVSSIKFNVSEIEILSTSTNNGESEISNWERKTFNTYQLLEKSKKQYEL